jgi:hypothetical protein
VSCAGWGWPVGRQIGGTKGLSRKLTERPVPDVRRILARSVTVFVMSGQVALQPNGSNVGPVAWSTKHNEWEQLRVCTDGTVDVGPLVIYNEDLAGGEFFVDRVEVLETP